MKTQLSTTVRHLNHVPLISSHVKTVDASTKDGLVIMTMTAEMVQTKESSVTLSTKHVQRKNLLARTLSASGINTDAVSFENFQ